MREILFKAKKWDSKDWVEGSLITLDADSGYYFISEPYTGASTLPVRDLIYNHTHLVDAKTICQYTGLTDKNDNKIWENDIVAYWDTYSTENGYAEADCIGKVYWDDETLSFQVTERLSAESYEVLDECSVIGNIFDILELLEG